MTNEQPMTTDDDDDDDDDESRGEKRARES